MARDYVESTVGRLVYAWRRDDGITWDVFVRDLRRGPRRVASLAGSKTHAQVVCQALSTCGSVLTPMFRLKDPLPEKGGDRETGLADSEARSQDSASDPVGGREGDGAERRPTSCQHGNPVGTYCCACHWTVLETDCPHFGKPGNYCVPCGRMVRAVQADDLPQEATG